MNIILTITLLQKTNLSIARKSMRLIAFEFHINFIWPTWAIWKFSRSNIL